MQQPQIIFPSTIAKITGGWKNCFVGILVRHTIKPNSVSVSVASCTRKVFENCFDCCFSLAPAAIACSACEVQFISNEPVNEDQVNRRAQRQVQKQHEVYNNARKTGNRWVCRIQLSSDMRNLTEWSGRELMRKLGAGVWVSKVTGNEGNIWGHLVDGWSKAGDRGRIAKKIGKEQESRENRGCEDGGSLSLNK